MEETQEIDYINDNEFSDMVNSLKFARNTQNEVKEVNNKIKDIF